MTEYWVSKQSYYCRYCEIYIRDDKPSRSQHENGLRHKGNLERYIRDIYKKEERLRHESREEARTIAKIDEAARIAHEELDLDLASTSKRTLDDRQCETDDPDDAKKKLRTAQEKWKGADNVINYSDARSLGLAIHDEDPTKDTKEARMTEGFVGEWQAVRRLPKTPGKPGTLASSVGSGVSATNTNKPSLRIAAQGDSDRAPPSKLFAERKIDDDSDPIEGIVIKVKVDRRAETRVKVEQDAAQLELHGSLQPIKLDGTQSESFRAKLLKSETMSDLNSACEYSLPTNLDIKPEPSDHTQVDTVSVPMSELGASTVFKKRKPTKAQPRRRT